ncbi:UNVERIFIED_CONTAM: hypothetical protein FKN15_006056 [Acipenser sinensis]
MIVTILEEIKGQERQNTLMLQALLKRQPQVEQERGSLRLDEFRFPLAIKEDIDRMERMLMDQATEKALVCDRSAAKKSSVTEADTEARMRSWLKYSGDRDGERKRRAEKKKDAEPANAATNAAARPASDIEED